MKRQSLTGIKSIVVFLVAVIVFQLVMSSCHSYRKVPYFTDIPDTLFNTAIARMPDTFINPKIQPNDVLQVTLYTLDPQVNVMMGGASSAVASANPGYLVGNDGVIVLPVMGKIKVGGLTTASARDTINERANAYFKNPIVIVRIANFKITVLGEVGRPSQFIVPDEKVSILDAIGMAGDLTIYGKRENVMLIRNIDNERKFVRMNLDSSSFFRSPYFYLRQGDVLYVEPNRNKYAATDTKQRDISIVSSLLSIAAIFTSILLNVRK